MPPINTHLVIGERVFPSLSLDEAVYGPFLLGCMLVDVNSFAEIDRRVTHFVGRLDEDGVDAFTKSCANFLAQLDDLLQFPWAELSPDARAFVTGYLCHLASDEPWKAWGMEIRQVLELDSLQQLPVPGEVILTAFSVASHNLHLDLDAALVALARSEVPNVFTHVSWADFNKMWAILEPVLAQGDSASSYFGMLQGIGVSDADLRAARELHAVHWEAALALIDEFGGVTSFVDTAVAHALEIVPRLDV